MAKTPHAPAATEPTEHHREPDVIQSADPAPAPTTAPPRGQQSFGERAVGLDFNPSGDKTVHALKELYAEIIDICDARRRNLMQGSEAHRLYAIAITQAQQAQMWAVKAATWKD